jgi:hypothetical protein
MNSKISARILVLVQSGMTLAYAMDAVLGEGTHSKLVGDLYDALRTEVSRTRAWQDRTKALELAARAEKDGECS